MSRLARASKAFSEVGRLLEPEAVADATIRGLEAEEFLILPHPEIKDFVQRKAVNIDRWLAGMRRFVAQSLRGR